MRSAERSWRRRGFARVLDAARADQQANETFLDPLSGLRAHPELPRELRFPCARFPPRSPTQLAPRAADAIARYGGADRAARDLALVLAAATARAVTAARTPRTPASAAPPPRARPPPALFSGLTHELELLRSLSPNTLEGLEGFSASRLLSAENQRDVEDAYGDAGARGIAIGFVVDELDEAAASLAARLRSEDASCFAGAGGVVTRTLRALGVLAENLEAVVARLRERSAEELKRCGLGAFALDANENETAADVATLTFFAARAEACRRRGLLRSEADLADAFGTDTNTAITETRTRDERLRRLRARVLASHLALADATRAEARAAEIGTRDEKHERGVSVSGSGTCLGDAFPPPDPRWDAPAGASLLTSTHALAFVVAALRDVTLSESACARALDAPPGVFFASPAWTRRAGSRGGVFPAAAAWLAAPAGSAGLEASVDEVQAVARACAVASAGGDAANATRIRKRWIRVERGPTDAALEFLRRLEAATLGRRGGHRGYSAVGKLVNALEKLVRDLERGGCLSLEPSRSGEEPSKSRESGSVSTASARTTSRAAADSARRADDATAVTREARRRRDPGEDPGPGSQGDRTARLITSDLILGVLFGVAAFALVAAAAEPSRAAQRAPAARSDASGVPRRPVGRRRRPPRLGPLVSARRRRRRVRAALLSTPRGGLRGRLAAGRGPRSSRVLARGEIARGQREPPL